MGVQRILKLIVVDYVAMGGSFVVDYVATDSGGLMHLLGNEGNLGGEYCNPNRRC